MIFTIYADIYSFPEVRKKLKDYPLFVQDIINIIDYDTELAMQGLASITFGALNDNYENTYASLIRCKLTKEANILKEARQLNPKNDNYDEEISKLESQTSLYNDYNSFWNIVRNYIENNKEKQC